MAQTPVMTRGRSASPGSALFTLAASLIALMTPCALHSADVEAINIDPGGPNTIEFAPREARFVRVLIHAAVSAQPCLDELEVYGPGSEDNLALADSGATASASSCLPGFTIHQIAHLNDGQYGNDHSWIAASERNEWAQIELPEPGQVDRIVFSRDRAGRYRDRVPTAFDVLTSMDGEKWETAAKLVAANIIVPEEKVLFPNRPISLTFPATETKFVRIEISSTNNNSTPCVDELEVFAADSDVNLALASKGAKPSAASCIEGHAIHRIEHLNDGKYGNDHSWIADSVASWAQVELPAQAPVSRVVFSRDRGGSYKDRLPGQFDIKLSRDGKTWRVVKRIVALLNVPVGRPLPDEAPRDWAERIAMELPASMGDTASELVAQVETEDDVEPLLELYRLHMARRSLLRRLPLEFNPAALRRAVADLAESYPTQCRMPADFERTLAAYQEKLPALRRSLAEGSLEDIRKAMAQAEEVLAFSRQCLISNPLLGDDEILVLRRGVPASRRNDTYWDWGQKYGFTVNWSCDFRPKNPPIANWWDDELAALSLKTGEPRLRTLYKPPAGHMIQHPELHFDADRVAFTMPGPNGAFQVFEMRIDGTGLRQVTTDTGPDVDNGDPCYLPDGRIIFNSTRSFTGVPCEDGYSYVSNLCLTDADGSNTRMLTFDQESNWYPTVLNDGRVLYTRYEYANISHQFGRLLFRMNPDGTEQMAQYGSNSYWPNSIFYARPIPDHPSQFIGVVCGHHGPNRTGRLVLLDSNRGRHETSGAVQTIPGYGKPVERVVADALYGGDWPKFVHPWPLSDKYFLVSARLHPDQKKYAIYLVDVFDNITELCRVPGSSLLEPIPIRKRTKPPVIPDRAIPGATQGTVFLADVYQGLGLSGVPRGTVRKLRLFSYNYVYRDTGRRGFGHLATPGVDGPWEPRYLLGTVPVSEDGSAYFRVPANLPIAVEPLDEKGRALQVMRSWFTAMPGEVLSCVGCHEPQTAVPPVARSRSVLSADSIKPWRGPARGFDYEREVQPVLDRYCVGCHDGSRAGLPDLARKPEADKARINQEYHAATESTITTILTPSFIALHPYVRRPHAESNYAAQTAGEFLADTSPLVQMLEKGHHNVRLDEEAWDRLYTWIDLGAPDHGSWKYSEWGAPGNYHERRLAMLERYAGRTDDVEWMPPLGEAPRFQPPDPEPERPAVPECPGWPFDNATAHEKQQASGLPQTLSVDLGGGLSMDMCLVPAGEYLMGDAAGPSDERPVSRVRIKKPFYMSRHEVTNAQFAALVNPGHVSGHVSWRSIDWRGEGYSLDAPDQPAVRVSWIEADRFCRALSSRAGRTFTLPTEAQWEWACRAGSSSALWYGGLDDDFSTLENLAGREQLGFAFSGKRKWYLHDPRFDDGALVTASVGSYAPNPWGLCDMAGNACEWTRSAYRPYPYVSSDGRDDGSPEGEKVIRGGSWYDKPNRARSGFRWKYPAWLKVHNVGFRVITPVTEG